MNFRQPSWSAWLDLFYPPRCCACTRVDGEPFCCICALATLDGEVVSLRGFGTVRALWLYGGPVRQAIQRMKYGRRIEIARALGSVIPRSHFDSRRYDILVPVPLSAHRLRSRHFNPALELCRRAPLGIETRSLRRQTMIRTQVGLGPQARRKNVHQAFVVRNPRRISGKRVLLVDDVMTTGSTLLASGQALRAAGARSVEGLVLARTMVDDPNIEVINH
jgi:ComF family protein